MGLGSRLDLCPCAFDPVRHAADKSFLLRESAAGVALDSWGSGL